MVLATDCCTVCWMVFSCLVINGVWFFSKMDCSIGFTFGDMLKLFFEFTEEEFLVIFVIFFVIGSGCVIVGFVICGLFLFLIFWTRLVCLFVSVKGFRVGWKGFCRRLISCVLFLVMGRLRV